jgi:hypothetical protein
MLLLAHKEKLLKFETDTGTEKQAMAYALWDR